MRRNILLAIICISIVVTIALLSAIPVGLHTTQETSASVLRSQIIHTVQEGEPDYGAKSGPIVYTMQFTNTFLPRQQLLPQANACLFNSKTGQGTYLGVRWQINQETKQDLIDSNANVIQLGIGTQTAQLKLEPFTLWKPAPTPVARSLPPEQLPPHYDAIYVFLTEQSGFQSYYPDCGNLQQADLAKAHKILVVND